MAPVVRISDDTFAMLQKIAQPLVDTPDSAIRRALGVYLEWQQRNPSAEPTPKRQPIPSKATAGKFFKPDSPPDLTHTSVLSGNIAGTSVNKWNHLMEEAHAQAYKALRGDIDGLQRISEAHIKRGDTVDSGFKPVKNCGFSVQGVEANKAWAVSLRLAKKFRFPISVEFRWQQKDGAAYPGEIGQIVWTPDA
ncbi:MAG: hypothetical protein AB1710_07060 [Pseudomonadota bacterium]